ncbi:MAG: energy transducer TonB [Bacteroidota bacterium]
MAIEEQRVESLEEIVFKNRNKEYGSYVLRKKYRRYLTISLIIGLLVIMSAAAYPLINAYLNKEKLLREKEKSVTAEMLNMPKEDLPPPPPPPPPPEALVEKVKFTAPKVVEDTNVESDFGKQDLLNQKGNTEVPSEEVQVEEKEVKTQVIEQKVEAEVFLIVEEPPTFPGGDAALYKWLGENLKYPEEAKELGIQGRVFVSFVVEPDGSTSNAVVKRGIGGGCDEEALRIVKAMPKWGAGKQRGQPVRVQFNLPIKFTLQ